MATLEDLLNIINFTSGEVKTVSDAMNNLLATIRSKALEKKIPAPMNFHIYGSVSRKTKIKPLDDIDILYVIGKAVNSPSENKHIITECNYTFESDAYEPEGNISSVKLLNRIKSVIVETYWKSDVRRNKEVVNVYLDSYGVGFDIAPAFDIGAYYLIPSGGTKHLWNRTNPFIGNDFINRINLKLNGHFLNAIKIIKYWFFKKQIVTPMSYHLECVLANYFDSDNTDIADLIVAVYLSLVNINHSGFLNACPDPFGQNKTLTSDLSGDDINKIVEEATYASQLIKTKGVDAFVKYIDPEIK